MPTAFVRTHFTVPCSNGRTDGIWSELDVLGLVLNELMCAQGFAYLRAIWLDEVPLTRPMKVPAEHWLHCFEIDAAAALPTRPSFSSIMKTTATSTARQGLPHRLQRVRGDKPKSGQLPSFRGRLPLPCRGPVHLLVQNPDGTPLGA